MTVRFYNLIISTSVLPSDLPVHALKQLHPQNTSGSLEVVISKLDEIRWTHFDAVSKINPSLRVSMRFVFLYFSLLAHWLEGSITNRARRIRNLALFSALSETLLSRKRIDHNTNRNLCIGERLQNSPSMAVFLLQPPGKVICSLSADSQWNL